MRYRYTVHAEATGTLESDTPRAAEDAALEVGGHQIETGDCIYVIEVEEAKE